MSSAGFVASGKAHCDLSVENVRRNLDAETQLDERLFGTERMTSVGVDKASVRDAAMPSEENASNKARREAQPSASAARCQPG